MYSHKNYTGERILSRIGVLLFLSSALVSADTYEVGKTFQDCLTCPEMVVVPKGQFLMGSSEDDRASWSDERPQHEVNIPKPFAVGKYEVTVGQFSEFIKEEGYKVRGMCQKYDFDSGDWDLEADLNWENPGFEQTDDHPVVCVAWDDAKAYVERLSRETGKTYRLLSEAEWEYVARAGTTTIYHFSAEISTEKANYNRANDGTVKVGEYDCNAFDLCDIYGNVQEWVEDCWHDDYGGAPSDGRAWSDGCDSMGDLAGVNTRILRGGTWTDNKVDLRSAFRFNGAAWLRDNETGFRVARDLD